MEATVAMDTEDPVTNKEAEPTAREKLESRLYPNVNARTNNWRFIRMLAGEDLAKPTSGWLPKHCTHVYCLKCNKIIGKYKSGDSKLASRHMELRHTTDLEDMKKAELAAQEPQRQMMHDLVQVSNKRMKLCGTSDQENLKNLLALWIAESFRPLSIVEDPGFCLLIHYINEMKFAVGKLPCRSTITNHIHHLAAKGRVKLAQAISKEVKFFCVTTDIWTSRSLLSFMAVTLHYMNTNFELKSFNLEVAPFSGKYSGQRIADELEATFSSWGLLYKDSLSLLLLDNASNGVKACEEIRVVSER
jgi:hypothetical protein